jgi:outer membrane protein assembly factor BamD
MKLLRHLIAAIAVAAVSACASSQMDVAQPDAMLMDNANNFYSRGRYAQAVDLYRKSVEHNPDSPHRKGAALGLADALYKEKEYFEAALYYERFVELYPLDPATPRAYFYLAMCSYNDVRSPDRDQANTKKAKEAFTRFAEKYPNHLLTPFAKKFTGEMVSRQIESEMEVIRFYHRVNKNQAVIWRVTDHIKQYPSSPFMEEAQFLLGECYYREQLYKEAASVFIALIGKNPAGAYSADATKLAENIKLQGK